MTSTIKRRGEGDDLETRCSHSAENVIAAQGDPSLINQALLKLGACGVVVWHLFPESGEVQVEKYWSDITHNQALLKRSRELSHKAIVARKSQASVLTSPNEILLVAQPFSTSLKCLSVAYHCHLSELCDETTQRRMELVELLAGELEGVSPDIIHEDLEFGLELSPKSRPVKESVPAAISWRELIRLLKSRIATDYCAYRRGYKIWCAALAGAIGLGSIPWPHRIHCNVVCEPLVRRYVAAPFDGVIERTNVLVGDRVTAGTVLATLDGSDLRSELAGLHAKLAQESQAQLSALASGDHAKAEFARLEVEHLEQSIALLKHRQRNLEIQSPIDGLIVSGDLERAIGAPVRIGDQLFEVASLESLVAEIAIPESQIVYINKAMDVGITLESLHGSTLESKLERINLRSEVIDGQSVFVAEAPLENPDNQLRPGMSGRASISAGKRPIAWLLFHRPYESLRQWIGL